MPVVNARDLYDRDFFEWTQCNAALLRAGHLDQADIEHIAEEIEDMGRNDRRELRSRLRVLLTHLLKWQFQPELREVSFSWRQTIRTQRRDIIDLLKDAPSLKPHLLQALPDAYADAVEDAAFETHLPEAVFPRSSPYSLDQILDRKFFPA